jgi:hypothetical protein
LTQITNDLEVAPRIAAYRERGSHKLHAPLGVRERAFLLRKTHAGQNHMRHLRGLVQEDILHHKELDLLKRFTDVIGVRVGEHRVLAHDVQRLDAPIEHAVHQLSDGQPGLRWNLHRCLPRVLELRPHILINDRLIARDDIRKPAHIARTLDVVLSAQRIDACAGSPEVAGQQSQIRQRLDVIHTVRRLRNAHRPEDGSASRPTVHLRGLDDQIRRDACDVLSPLRRAVLDRLFERIEVFRSRCR